MSRLVLLNGFPHLGSHYRVPVRPAALLLSHDDAAAWAEMQHRLAAVTAARTATIVISSAAGAIDDALDALERAINP